MEEERAEGGRGYNITYFQREARLVVVERHVWDLLPDGDGRVPGDEDAVLALPRVDPDAQRHDALHM